MKPLLSIFSPKKSSKEYYKEFFNWNVSNFSKFLAKTKPDFLEKEGEKRALKLFKEVSQKIPAYKDFLKKHKINPKRIKTIKDFKKLPITTKKNYLKKYPLSSLFYKNKFSTLDLISVSSGSTGKPFFWPRESYLEFETTYLHELFLKNFFEIDKLSTLLIIGYSMGIYVAGVFTLNACLRLAQKGYPLTVISPGINKNEILRIIKELGNKYSQIILTGYPPFVKDIIDLGEEYKINWKKIKMKFIFGAEGFSENWRNYILKKVGSKNPLKDSMNTYGSADAAILGHETPLTILIRRLASKNKKLNQALFNDSRLPSLHQYYPFLKFFEVNEKGELIFTTQGGLPLIRYNIGDQGGIISFFQMMRILAQYGYSQSWIKQTLKKYKANHLLWKLPFVYLFGRADFTVSLYGVKIYPENIKSALESKFLNNICSGKFIMSTEYRKNQDQYLSINIELLKGIKPTKKLLEKITRVLVNKLRKVNLEYNRLFEAIGPKAIPQITLSMYGESKYFLPRVKQKWVKNKKI
jgi:phenylacetate-CoA ligase